MLETKFLARPACAALLISLTLAGCDSTRVNGRYGGPEGPTMDQVYAQWVDEGWDGTKPVGHPEVVVEWIAPTDFTNESFNVYSRRSGGDWILSATVTSCASSRCSYHDRDVRAGERYDYYVATLDERTGEEAASDQSLPVTIPAYQPPATPAAPTAVSLDGAVFLQWPDAAGAQRYRVFQEQVDNQAVFYEIGASDGNSYLDDRAPNGHRYSYSVAAVDSTGRPGPRSPLVTAAPRPDYHAELLYALQVKPDSSGFRFVDSEAQVPTVPGTSTQAQWRLEITGGRLYIVPLGATAVTGGVFTTALSCGPGSEADCESISTAPSSASFSTAPAEVLTGNTYVFRVVADDGKTHYAKLRATGWTTDSAGPRALVFDWAYQLLPEEPSLNRVLR
ncbi:MAG TPA: hypothetical protein VFL93_05155 [Longimicrobiaceae bacterium]|nr:hypothetical protein [Longimicrobiaceae bacterium]